jgi:predicted ribonuclease YlaK
MFTVLILVCAAGLDQSACQPDTAIDIIRGPSARNEIVCLHDAQSIMAVTAIVPRAGQEYMKIVCSRTSAKG